MDASIYNVQYYIQKLESLTEYNFPFERVKQIKEQITGVKEEDEEPKTEEIKDEETPNPDQSIEEKLKD